MAARPRDVTRLEVEHPRTVVVELHVAELDERPPDHCLVSAGATELEALLRPPFRRREVAQALCDPRRSPEEFVRIEGGRLGRLERMPKVTERLAKEPAQGEEVVGGSRELDLQVRVMVAGPADCAAEVLQVGVEASQPLLCGRS